MPSPIAVLDRRHVPEVRKRPQRLAFKGVEQTDTQAGQMLAVDEHEGIVTAIVSVTGIEDEVADIIVPGAYADTLVKRRPKVCWAHSWEQPIGRVLHIEELMPGDERLPAQTRDGKAWPADAGALVASMQFNMYSTKGREAFAAVLFYTETAECEYSIGYQARKAFKDKAGVRHIKSLDLFELSVVLFGAHTMTGTLSIKSATATVRGGAARHRLTEIKAARQGHAPPQAVQAAAAQGLALREQFGRGGTAVGVARARDLSNAKNISPEVIGRMVAFFARHTPDKAADGWGSKSDPSNGYIAWLLWGGDAGQAWAKGIAKEGKAARPDDESTEDGTDDHVASDPGSEDDDHAAAPDFSDGIMVAVYPDAAAADAVAEQIAGPDPTTDRSELHVTLAFLGNTGDTAMESDALIRIVEEAIEGMPRLEGEIAGIGMFPDTGDGAPTWAPVDVPGLGRLREVIAQALGDNMRHDHGFTPHMTLGYGIGLVQPISPVPVTFDNVRVVYGHQQHNITLGQSVQSSGKSLDVDMDAYLNGFTDDDWWALVDTIATDEVDEISVKAILDGLDAVEVKALLDGKAVTPGGRVGDDSSLGTPGGRENWVDKAGGLPRYIRMVANALKRQGKTTSRAIAIAVATMKRWAANASGKVSAKVQAAAAKAVAQWEAMKASTRAKKSAYDPSLDGKSAAPALATGSGYPYLDGTLEQHVDAVRTAVNDALLGGEDDDGNREWDSVDVVGTWMNRVVARRASYTGGNRDRSEHYEIPYEVVEGVVHLGDADRVTLQVVALTEDGEEEADVSIADAVPMSEEINRLATILRVAHAQQVEGKAGRVLSGRNERNLREAVTRLIEVLEVAGVRIVLDDDERRREEAQPDTGADTRREVDPDIDLETTSQSASARVGAKSAADLTPQDMAATIAHFTQVARDG